MPIPDYLICANCETPCYVFEWEDGEVREAICPVCGNDETEQFVTEEDIEAYGQD